MSPDLLHPVTAADLDVLLDLAWAFHAEDGHPLTPVGEAALRRLVEGEPLARGWLVRHDGRTVGYVVLCLGFSIEYGGRDGFIDDLYLVPEARGQGLGTRVLAASLDEARSLGVRALHLEVEPANRRAAALYKRHGFAATGRTLLTCPLG